MPRPKKICGECIRNPGIRAFIAERASTTICAFCRRRGANRKTASLEDVAAFILERAEQDYGDPADWLPYDSGEGGYQAASTFTTWELLREHLPLSLAPAQNDAVLDALQELMPASDWCERDPLSLSTFQVLRFSWSAFCQTVKRKNRYFFGTSIASVGQGERDEMLAPLELLREIGGLVGTHGLVGQVEAGKRFYRAGRVSRERRFATVLDFGPPPAERAVKANRMNPPGIPMFYAASNRLTAIAEVWEGPGTYAVGTFATRRPLLLLDLSTSSRDIDYFEMDSEPLQRMRFVERFREAIAEPAARDDRNHIDYVPTQIVAEYFRTVYRYHDQALDGVVWRSAARRGAQSCVLFASQADLVLTPREAAGLAEEERERRDQRDGWLELVARSRVQLRKAPLQKRNK